MKEKFPYFIKWEILIKILNERSKEGYHLDYKKNNVFTFVEDKKVRYEYYLYEKNISSIKPDVELVSDESNFVFKFLLPTICKVKVGDDSITTNFVPHSNFERGHRFLIVSMIEILVIGCLEYILNFDLLVSSIIFVLALFIINSIIFYFYDRYIVKKYNI